MSVLQRVGAEPFFIVKDDKIECTLNGHRIPLNNGEQLSAFVSGKKFQVLLEKENEKLKLKKLEPFLVPSQRLEGYLFCALTKQLVQAKYELARKHMKGLKFLKAKERFFNDEVDLFEEPEEIAKPVRRQGIRAGRASKMEVDAQQESGQSEEGPGSDADVSNFEDLEIEVFAEELIEGPESDDTVGKQPPAEESAARLRKKAVRKQRKLEKKMAKLQSNSGQQTDGKRKRDEAALENGKKMRSRH